MALLTVCRALLSVHRALFKRVYASYKSCVGRFQVSMRRCWCELIHIYNSNWSYIQLKRALCINSNHIDVVRCPWRFHSCDLTHSLCVWNFTFQNIYLCMYMCVLVHPCDVTYSLCVSSDLMRMTLRGVLRVFKLMRLMWLVFMCVLDFMWLIGVKWKMTWILITFISLSKRHELRHLTSCVTLTSCDWW